MKVMSEKRFVLTVSLCLLIALTACSENEQPVVKDFPIVYVKRKIDRAGENNDRPINPNPRDVAVFNPGGQLIIRDFSASGSPETNISARIPQIAAVDNVKTAGDISDPDVSYDGERIVFAAHEGMYDGRDPDEQPTWNIWEYDIPTDTLRRVIVSDLIAEEGNDVDPYYLPDDRIVFTSDRQARSVALLTELGGTPVASEDEDRRRPAFVLHVMDRAGQGIKQISFNQSSDRNPIVMRDGSIVYSRWDHLGGRNEFNLYRVDPSGENMDVFYGAHSHDSRTPLRSQLAFVHPREMQNGRIMTTVMDRTGTSDGGDLVIIDVANYREHNLTRVGTARAAGSGQFSASNYEVVATGGASKSGRYTTPFPLWDGANRALVAWTPCRMMQSTQDAMGNDLPFPFPNEIEISPCTDDNLGDPTLQLAPPWYGIYMLNLDENTKRPIVLPDEGWILTDPIAVLPRSFANTPQIITDKLLPDATGNPPVITDVVVQDWVNRSVGVLNIRSVFDTMGCTPAVDTPMEPRRGCNGNTSGPDVGVFAMTTAERDALTVAGARMIGVSIDLNAEPGEQQVYYPGESAPAGSISRTVLNIDNLRNPILTTANERVARFVRITKAAPTVDGVNNSAYGNSGGYEMREILGYAEVEPDGSVYVEVPAEVPLAVTVLDQYGMAIMTHNAWVQVMPGEERICVGCHAPPGQPSVNPGAPAANSGYPGATTNVLISNEAGETMAETRAYVSCQLDCSYPKLKRDIIYTDVWTDPTLSTPNPDIVMTYADSDPLDTVYDGLNTLAPMPTVPGDCATNWSTRCRIVINFEDHIMPLWSVERILDLDGDGPLAAVDIDGNGALDDPDPDDVFTCTRCHGTVVVDALGNPVIDPVTMLPMAQVPAGFLNLSGDRDTTLEQITDDNRVEQEVVNGVLVVSLQPGVDADGNPILVPIPVDYRLTRSGVGQARRSGLIEKMYEQKMQSSITDSRFVDNLKPGQTTIPIGDVMRPPHNMLLTPGEKRLLTEWVDNGQQRFNDPFHPNVNN